MEAMNAFLANDCPFDTAIDIGDLSIKPKKQNVIVEYLKWVIREGIFADQGFVVYFKDNTFSTFKKIHYGTNQQQIQKTDR